jgi:hypothetical protein
VQAHPVVVRTDRRDDDHVQLVAAECLDYRQRFAWRESEIAA